MPALVILLQFGTYYLLVPVLVPILTFSELLAWLLVISAQLNLPTST